MRDLTWGTTAPTAKKRLATAIPKRPVSASRAMIDQVMPEIHSDGDAARIRRALGRCTLSGPSGSLHHRTMPVHLQLSLSHRICSVTNVGRCGAWMWGIRQGEAGPGPSIGEFRNFVTGITALAVRFSKL